MFKTIKHFGRFLKRCGKYWWIGFRDIVWDNWAETWRETKNDEYENKKR